MAQSEVSGSLELIVSKEAGTLGGVLLVIGNPNQQKDKNTGVYEPNYAVAANQPIWYPNITNSVAGGVITGMGNFRNVNVFATTSQVVANGVATMPNSWEYTSYNNCPALKLKANSDVFMSKEIRFEFEVNIGTHWEKVVLGSQYSTTEVSAVSYQVYLEPDNGGVVDANATSPNCVLTPRVTLGTAQVTSGIYFMYYKLANGAWVLFNNGQDHTTVIPNKVDGVDTFKVDVHKTNASGEILCSDVQQVIDNSDPFKVWMTAQTFTSGSPAQTITPKVMQGEKDVSSSFTLTDIRLLDSTGALIKVGSMVNKNITITYDDGKADPGNPVLTARFK